MCALDLIAPEDDSCCEVPVVCADFGALVEDREESGDV